MGFGAVKYSLVATQCGQRCDAQRVASQGLREWIRSANGRWVSRSAVTCITPEGSGTGKGGNVVVADIAGFRLQPSWPAAAPPPRACSKAVATTPCRAGTYNSDFMYDNLYGLNCSDWGECSASCNPDPPLAAAYQWRTCACRDLYRDVEVRRHRLASLSHAVTTIGVRRTDSLRFRWTSACVKAARRWRSSAFAPTCRCAHRLSQVFYCHHSRRRAAMHVARGVTPLCIMPCCCRNLAINSCAWGRRALTGKSAARLRRLAAAVAGTIQPAHAASA